MRVSENYLSDFEPQTLTKIKSTTSVKLLPYPSLAVKWPDYTAQVCHKY